MIRRLLCSAKYGPRSRAGFLSQVRVHFREHKRKGSSDSIFAWRRLTPSGIDIKTAAIAWLVTFIVLCILILGVGFGRGGIIGGEDSTFALSSLLSSLFPFLSPLLFYYYYFLLFFFPSIALTKVQRLHCGFIPILYVWGIHTCGRNLCYLNKHGHVGQVLARRFAYRCPLSDSNSTDCLVSGARQRRRRAGRPCTRPRGLAGNGPMINFLLI